MAATLDGAETYIADYVIDNEDWTDAEDDKKQRIVNVANRTLTTEYPDRLIPDDAVYEFCATLAVVFNDTNKLQQQGIAGFSVTGVASFTFKENNVKTPGGASIITFASPTVLAIINAANPEKDPVGGGGKRVKDVTL